MAVSRGGVFFSCQKAGSDFDPNKAQVAAPAQPACYHGIGGQLNHCIESKK